MKSGSFSAFQYQTFAICGKRSWAYCGRAEVRCNVTNMMMVHGRDPEPKMDLPSSASKAGSARFGKLKRLVDGNQDIVGMSAARIDRKAAPASRRRAPAVSGYATSVATMCGVRCCNQFDSRSVRRWETGSMSLGVVLIIRLSFGRKPDS